MSTCPTYRNSVKSGLPSTIANVSTRLREGLLTWFKEKYRRLPWRERYAPYEVWVSEMMLQQTRVITVLPYYARWMERLPDVRAVAEAPEDELLRLWEGLGYYSRVRNMQAAARLMVERHGGKLPEDHEALLALPGIGRYTAAAILSIGFNRDYAVVDGNVERVLTRLFDIDAPLDGKEGRETVCGMAEALLPPGKARDFNQALMELGAVVCTPRSPVCSECPVAESCASLAAGTVDERPVKSPRKRAIPIEVAVGVLVRSGRVLIQKRPPTGLMANLWEFPGGKVEPGESPGEALKREFREELELAVEPVEEVATIRHAYTSFRVVLHAFWCGEKGRKKPVARSAVETRWVQGRELEDYAFPAANRRIVALIRERLGE